jgi:hypothetical protein
VTRSVSEVPPHRVSECFSLITRSVSEVPSFFVSAGPRLLLQTSRRPRLQIHAYLLRTRIDSGNNDMDVIRPTIHRMKMPPAPLARFSDLPLDRVALFDTEAARILHHFCSRFKLSHGIGKLPTMPVLDPPSAVAW